MGMVFDVYTHLHVLLFDLFLCSSSLTYIHTHLYIHVLYCYYCIVNTIIIVYNIYVLPIEYKVDYIICWPQNNQYSSFKVNKVSCEWMCVTFHVFIGSFGWAQFSG